MRSLEDLIWFCRPPEYNGGPKVSFVATVCDGLRIRDESGLSAVGNAKPPRIARFLSVLRDTDHGKELVSYIRNYEWKSVAMSEDSGLKPGDKVKVVALMMPSHHCHAPIQRIIRLRTTLLAPMIRRIRAEEVEGASDIEFWREWQKKAEDARKATGIGNQQGAQDGRADQ